ncbi:short-chain dehydrogenase [Fusarium sp. NRRL 52700]|nr:short-chain dehydrogenase [Fusarium sp. NRRL 52700]
METIDQNPLHGLHTYSSAEDVEFDFDLYFTSPILLNAALESYQVAGGLGREWSVPKGRAEGSFKVDGEKADIVPKKSFAWYDRLVGYLAHVCLEVVGPRGWLEDVCYCQKLPQQPRLCGPINLTASTTKVWVSPDTGLEYPQEWTIRWENTELLVTSPRPDQVIEADDDTGFPSRFSGYVNVVATKAGYNPIRGFGAVDRMRIE